jgi:hypothetical protein
MGNFGRQIALLVLGCVGGGFVVSCGGGGGAPSTSVFDASGIVDASKAAAVDSPFPSGDDDSGGSTGYSLIGEAGLGCVAKKCVDLGFSCGQNSDGCGNVLDCGTCPSDQFCGGGGYSKCGVGVDAGSSGDGGAACMPATCSALAINCGRTGDGCGSVLDCGMCPTGQFCGGGGFDLCGVGMIDGGPPCTPKTCESLNYNCGPAGDGCGGALDCGTCPAGQYCGGGGFDVCGMGSNGDAGSSCIPKACADLKYNCGVASDGCGGSLNCGTCTSPAFCGGGGFDTCGGVMYPPDAGVPCTPLTCAQLGFNCGPAGDGCGGSLNCGTTCVSATDTCGGGGTPGVCGNSSCKGLCAEQTTCDGGAPTAITGTVFAGVSAWTGAPPDPVPNVLVYVPNTALQPFTPGASCRQCGADVSGQPIASTYTDFDGTFTLTNVPSGTDIPLVIQLGRWRRQFTFSAQACTTTALPQSLNLPRNQSEGEIPLTAISTGNFDALECVLLKMGVDQTEFTADTGAGGTGRIQIYAGDPGPNGGTLNGGNPGASVGAGTRTEVALLGANGTFMNYDQIMLPCWGAAATKTAAELANLVTYSDSGGHFFATHYSYSWLVNNAEFANVAVWHPNFDNPGDVDWTLNVSTAVPPSPPSPHVETFAKWLNFVDALSDSAATVPVNPQVSIENPRHDADGVANGSVDWIDGTDQGQNSSTCPRSGFCGNGTPLVEHFTFNTPVGATSQCGHDIFSDFHVTNAGGTNGMVFPAECDANPLTPQERILEFMIWDLASCVPPPTPPACTKQTCAAQSITCGPAGDGCGGSLDCGSCPPGEQCGGNGTYGQCIAIPDSGSCTPQTCTQQSITCGPAGDGCGNSLDCGKCVAPETCGGGGVAGKCGGGCVPLTCPQQNITCGPAGDGCGGSLDCGPCTPPLECGGGGVPGQCGGGGCTPSTCTTQNVACGPAGDGCGNLLDCGPCPTGQTCSQGQCVAACTPLTCAQLNISCGPAGDGCGGLLQCGMCPPPMMCGGAGVPGQCGGAAM